MIFQRKNYIPVFQFIVIYIQLGASSNLQGLNKTLFLFNNPKTCKNNEYYNLDLFLCLPCESKDNLKPSFDKLSCSCNRSETILTLYDSSKNKPICFKHCQSRNISSCTNSTALKSPEKFCKLNFINSTSVVKDIPTKSERFYSDLAIYWNECKCDLKYNYIYGDHCIWMPLLKNYLNSYAFWKRGKLFTDIKFIAFFCQSLRNTTACNYLANLCIQSFFDTDKNSPCSVFLLSQASDVTFFSNMGDNLNSFRPFLFYKKGKETVQELEQTIEITDDNLKLFSMIYSLEGQLNRWDNFQPTVVNPCIDDFSNRHGTFQLFKNNRVSCQRTLNYIIDLATTHGNKDFVSVFLNHTRENGKQYLKTIPVLIKNTFDGNNERSPAEWQLVKRFQLIAAEKSFNTMAPYEDSYKIQLYKSIRMLKKFELRCTVSEDNKISVPLMVLEYLTIDISKNSSLDEEYNFEFSVNFEKHETSVSRKIYAISIPIFAITSLLIAVFRAYIFKSRRNLECCDMQVFIQTILNLLSNIGMSFLLVVIIDVFYSVFTTVLSHDVILESTDDGKYFFEFLIITALAFKGFCFFVKFWRISQIDIFFVDWERPKSYDPLILLKNNVETSSQCSSIRTFTENNVSAWRIFFLANEFINLSSKQKISSLFQGFLAIVVFWITRSYFPAFYSNSSLKIFICVVIFSSVQIVQNLIRSLLLDQLLGSPLTKFIDICTLANVSIFTLIDTSFGFYIHGRSPHGFSDTDMTSMIFQLQRESQNMCGKRGLLNDSDFQTYIVLPPLNLRKHIEKLLPIKQRTDSLSQHRFQKDVGFSSRNLEGVFERNTSSYNRVNRFFCAFIDHAIKDMDYIIKEKTFFEKLLNCEFESFVDEQKGTFYIDDGLSFSSLFLYGNQEDIFVMELLIFLTLNLLTDNFTLSVVLVCILNKLFQKMFRFWVKNNLSVKTLIENRFLM